MSVVDGRVGLIEDWDEWKGDNNDDAIDDDNDDATDDDNDDAKDDILFWLDSIFVVLDKSFELEKKSAKRSLSGSAASLVSIGISSLLSSSNISAWESSLCTDVSLWRIFDSFSFFIGEICDKGTVFVFFPFVTLFLIGASFFFVKKSSQFDGCKGPSSWLVCLCSAILVLSVWSASPSLAFISISLYCLLFNFRSTTLCCIEFCEFWC